MADAAGGHCGQPAGAVEGVGHRRMLAQSVKLKDWRRVWGSFGWEVAQDLEFFDPCAKDSTSPKAAANVILKDLTPTRVLHIRAQRPSLYRHEVGNRI